MTDKELIITLRSMESRSKRAVLNAAADRLEELVAYKQTGMEPEELLSATDMAKVACALHELNAYKDLGPIDRLRELAQADRERRCVVLPCKVGDTVYRVVTPTPGPPLLSEMKITTMKQAASLVNLVGKHKLVSYYLTREEAEAALREAEG